MESDLGERDILIEFSKGNPVAFEEIYNRFYASIFLLAKRYVHSDDDAKDIRAGCFMRLWECRDSLSFNNMSRLYSWLRVIVYNKCIDYIRKSCDRRKVEREVVYLSRFEVFEICEKEAAIINSLLTKIEKLPIKLKTVFKMRCFNELKFREIASELNISDDLAKKRYACAIELMKRKPKIKTYASRIKKSL